MDSECLESEGWDPNSGKRWPEMAFKLSFQCFFNKAFIKFSRKRGGGGGRLWPFRPLP